MVVANNKIYGNKNTPQLLAVLMAMRIWRCNQGHMLDRSGQPDMAGNYEKELAARKLLNVKDTHSDRHLYGSATQLLAQREIVETKIVLKP
jgi:hypothetical protein